LKSIEQVDAMKNLKILKAAKPPAKPVKRKQLLKGPKVIEKVVSVNDISPV
jgi:hypothetical protein